MVRIVTRQVTKKTEYTKKYHNITKKEKENSAFYTIKQNALFFYVTNSVYMEQKPETGKSTDKTKNTCYTSTIKANEKNDLSES